MYEILLHVSCSIKFHIYIVCGKSSFDQCYAMQNCQNEDRTICQLFPIRIILMGFSTNSVRVCVCVPTVTTKLAKLFYYPRPFNTHVPTYDIMWYIHTAVSDI